MDIVTYYMKYEGFQEDGCEGLLQSGMTTNVLVWEWYFTLILGNSVNGIVGDKYDVDEYAVGKWILEW